MSALVEELWGLAFQVASGEQANEALARAREARGHGGAPALSYEVALPAAGAEPWLLSTALPRLVYFLDCRGLSPTAAPGVFVSLFGPQGLALLGAEDFLRVLAARRGLSPAELVRRYGERGTGDPLALGTGG